MRDTAHPSISNRRLKDKTAISGMQTGSVCGVASVRDHQTISVMVALNGPVVNARLSKCIYMLSYPIIA